MELVNDSRTPPSDRSGLGIANVSSSTNSNYTVAWGTKIASTYQLIVSVAATSTPLLNYPYVGTREALNVLGRASDQNPCHGVKTRYINPLTGDYAMPTMGAFAQLLVRGFRGLPYHSTDSTIYQVIEGSGRTIVSGEVLEWRAHDVFVVPSWKWHHHQADAESVLFSFSDRPVQQKLGLWREQRGHHN